MSDYEAILCDNFEEYEDQGQIWFKSERPDMCQICKANIHYEGDGLYMCPICGTTWDIEQDNFYVDEIGQPLYTHQIHQTED